jgi:hypothetical protein
MSILLQRFSAATGKTIVSVEQVEDEMVVRTADKEEFRAYVLDMTGMDDLIQAAAAHWPQDKEAP